MFRGSLDVCLNHAIHLGLGLYGLVRCFRGATLLSNLHCVVRVAMVALVVLPGCKTTRVVHDDAAKRKMLALIMPSRIEIVQPFTRVKSFDDDAVPDGIELLLQAINSLDNSGLMIAGDMRIELFEHTPASGNPRGRRLEMWEIQIASRKQQETYWNQVSQMYEFRLGVSRETLPAADKFVVRVTYNSPLGDHLSDECIIGRPKMGQSLGSGG